MSFATDGRLAKPRQFPHFKKISEKVGMPQAATTFYATATRLASTACASIRSTGTVS